MENRLNLTITADIYHLLSAFYSIRLVNLHRTPGKSQLLPLQFRERKLRFKMLNDLSEIKWPVNGTTGEPEEPVCCIFFSRILFCTFRILEGTRTGRASWGSAFEHDQAVNYLLQEDNSITWILSVLLLLSPRFPVSPCPLPGK